MEGFRVNVTLGAPIATGKLPYAPTLDSVLLGLMSKGEYLTGADGDRLIEQFRSMIAVYDGVPATSTLLPDSTLSWGVDAHPRKPSATEIRRWNKLSYRSDSGEFLIKMHSLRLVFAQQWEWYGVGDIDKVTEVLGSLVAVGARRGSGYGMVASWSVVRTENTVWLYNGLDRPQLSRPVPVNRVDKLLGERTLTRSDLTGPHAIVPLPHWPTPSWGGDFEPEPTMIPIAW